MLKALLGVAVMAILVAGQPRVADAATWKDLLSAAQLLQKNKQYDKAISLYDAVLRVKPTNADAFMGKGVSLINAKRHDEVPALMRQISASGSIDNTLWSLGSLFLINSGRSDQVPEWRDRFFARLKMIGSTSSDQLLVDSFWVDANSGKLEVEAYEAYGDLTGQSQWVLYRYLVYSSTPDRKVIGEYVLSSNKTETEAARAAGEIGRDVVRYGLNYTPKPGSQAFVSKYDVRNTRKPSFKAGELALVNHLKNQPQMAGKDRYEPLYVEMDGPQPLWTTQ